MAYDIKELTKEIHQNAERQEFVKTLMSGTIRPELYAIYLYNQLQCYSVLEKYGMANDLFRQTPGLQRAENIHRDYAKLWPDLSNPPKITDSTEKSSPTFIKPIAIPATGSLNGTPASIRASEVPQTVAIEDEPLDSVISDTILNV